MTTRRDLLKMAGAALVAPALPTPMTALHRNVKSLFVTATVEGLIGKSDQAQLQAFHQAMLQSLPDARRSFQQGIGMEAA